MTALATTPFPQIRGTSLERLFFSAPEHNVKTCRVCRRRRRAPSPASDFNGPFWSTGRRGNGAEALINGDDQAVQSDEGFEDGEVDIGGDAGGHLDPRANDKGKAAEVDPPNLDFLAKGTPKDRLPPQTVLMKVLRELEDDFTHYKGCVLHYLVALSCYYLPSAEANVILSF